MKQALLRHYGKIMLTILVMGASAYFRVDLSGLLSQLGTAKSVPTLEAPDAGN